MVILDNFQDAILISIGAVFGANTRFVIYKKLDELNLNKNSIILLINTFSSFSLGFFLSISPQIRSLSYSYQFGLFFVVGVLGSLSTFSAFIYDLYELFIQFKFYRAFQLFIISLSLGILSFAVGFFLGIL